jgi:N-acetylneuraminic acid mutarotase
MNKKLVLSLIVILVASMFVTAFQFAPAGAAQNEWASGARMPTARGGLGVAAVNRKIYAIGGVNNGTYFAVNEEYDSATDKWSAKAPMPTARSGVAVAVFQNKIYVIGGTGDSGILEVNEVYDTARNIWETKANMPTARADMCASVVDGKIYVIGGKEDWGVEPSYHELGVNEVYDPETDTWSTNASLPIPAFGYASAVVNDEIYVIGGARQFLANLSGLVAIDSVQVYNATNDSWRNAASLPNARSFGAAVATSGLIAPKRIYVLGGYDQNAYSSTNRVYDVERNSWSSGTSLPSARVYLAVAELDDVLYAIGGFDGENWLDINEQYLPVGYGTVPPEIQILAPENKTYASNSVALALSVNRPTEWIGYSLDAHANATVAGDAMLSGLSEGSHTIKVYANDSFGNVGSSITAYFSVDTVAPKVVVLFPENVSYGGSDVQSSFTVDEPVSWMGYSLDGADNVTVSGNVTLAVLADGSHKITFYAMDLVGNTGASRTVYFTIAPFPTLLVVAVAVSITIVAATGYLLMKRRKAIVKKITADKRSTSNKKAPKKVLFEGVIG